MHIYEINDLMFLIKSLKSPTDNFEIKDYVYLLLSEILPDQEHITSYPILELHQLFKDTFILT